MQSVPIPAMMGRCEGVIGCSGLFIPELLEKELKEGWENNGKPVELIIDYNAVVINSEHMSAETSMKSRIGSTGEGVGSATADKVMRKTGITSWDLVGTGKVLPGVNADPWMRKVNIIPDTARYINKALIDGKKVIVEATQGVGLSLHSGGYYPFCTSRECTPQGVLGEAGIAQDNALDLVERIMVIRTYPIRVGGNSGPMYKEITWDQLKDRTGGYVQTPEITTVTKKTRRISEFDWDEAERAIIVTCPTSIALMFFDYLHPDSARLTDSSALTKEHWTTINRFEKKLGYPIKLLGTGPGTTISLRNTI